MIEFSVAGRAYRLDRLRLGEIKALARINESPIEGGVEGMIERFARIVEAATARFGAEAFIVSDEVECTAKELTEAAGAILRLGGFLPGEA